MDQDLSYPDAFADRLELVWGAGFLSPGGADEVRQIIGDTEMRGKSVLEIGCGIGGPAIVIAGEYHAGKVTGVDIEPQLVERAWRNAAQAGLGEKIEFRLVEPGPLPFEDGALDMVFSKDAIVHIEDKLAVYGEIFRVLKPGGGFVAGDWFAGENADDLPEFQHYRQLSHLTFAMQTADEARAVLQEAGFADVALNDRNEWYAGFAREQIERIEGPLRDRLIDVCGADGYRDMLKVSYANAGAAGCGGLRPTHIRALKP